MLLGHTCASAFRCKWPAHWITATGNLTPGTVSDLQLPGLRNTVCCAQQEHCVPLDTGSSLKKPVLLCAGTPESATRFCNSLGFPKDNLYCDPDMKIYKDVGGLQSGALATFASPASIKVFLGSCLTQASSFCHQALTLTLRLPAEHIQAGRGHVARSDKEVRMHWLGDCSMTNRHAIKCLRLLS